MRVILLKNLMHTFNMNKLLAKLILLIEVIFHCVPIIIYKTEKFLTNYFTIIENLFKELGFNIYYDVKVIN